MAHTHTHLHGGKINPIATQGWNSGAEWCSRVWVPPTSDSTDLVPLGRGTLGATGQRAGCHPPAILRTWSHWAEVLWGLQGKGLGATHQRFYGLGLIGQRYSGGYRAKGWVPPTSDSMDLVPLGRGTLGATWLRHFNDVLGARGNLIQMFQGLDVSWLTGATYPRYLCGMDVSRLTGATYPRYLCGMDVSRLTGATYPRYLCGMDVSRLTGATYPRYLCGMDVSRLTGATYPRYLCGMDVSRLTGATYPRYLCGMDASRLTGATYPRYLCGMDVSRLTGATYPRYLCGMDVSRLMGATYPRYLCGMDVSRLMGATYPRYLCGMDAPGLEFLGAISRAHYGREHKPSSSNQAAFEPSEHYGNERESFVSTLCRINPAAPYGAGAPAFCPTPLGPFPSIPLTFTPPSCGCHKSLK
eukprot:XP_017945956.1 PREDICTED: uncharacterized protein LOC108645358 isoform X4 [Xenopus tropicalis]